MGVRQESPPRGAATLRRQIVPTELGPCMVRVQQRAGGRGSASGTPVAYLHGAAGSWTSFVPLLSGATAHDRVLIDLPGWGESTEGARLEHFSIEAMAGAVTGIQNALGYRRWHLVGHSMGGFLALHMAAAWPERTASVAAISSTTFGVSEAARRPVRALFRFPAFAGMLLLMRSLAALGPVGSALVRAVSTTPVMDPLMSPFFADPVAITASLIRGLGEDARPASFSAAARAAAHYDFDQWRGIHCPVLATRGDSDVFTPPSDLSRLADLVPHAQVVTIPRCGHFANFERSEQLLGLLDDLWSPRPVKDRGWLRVPCGRYSTRLPVRPTVNLMSDIPTDEGPEADQTETVPELLADALSPVVHPDFDSGSRAGSGSDDGNADSDRGNSTGSGDTPDPK